jgi:hypothetical protein
MPSAAGVTYWWSVMTSPAFITSGPPVALSFRIALNAADSEFPVRDTRQTGEQTLNWLAE